MAVGSGATIAVAAAALMLAAGAGSVPAQQQQQPQAQNSQIPDAPRPQSLPQVPSLAPAVSGIVPPAPAAQDPNSPGSTLPAGPATDAVQTAPPDVVTGADAVNQFTLGAVNVQFVEVPFTVKDNKNRLVPGITYRDVQVFENGYRQAIRLFTTDPFPLSVALVIDQSVTQDTMTKINNSLTALQGAFTPYDEIAVFTYNNGVKMQDNAFDAAQSPRLTAILARSKAAGREPVMGLSGPLAQGPIVNNQTVPTPENMGHTGPAMSLQPEKEFHTLYDAIFQAAQQTTHAAKGRRRIVYVISDGKEYGSKVSARDVIRYCQTNNIQIYATLIGDSSVPGLGFLDRIHLPGTMRDDALPRLVQATGGQTDAEFRQRGIEQSFGRISEEVRTQYTIGYYSHEPPLDEKFRRIEVRVLRPGLTVTAKDGYYPRPDRSSVPAGITAVPPKSNIVSPQAPPQ